MFTWKWKQGGFTLIEMLIVLFIIGALILILVPNLTDAGEQAQQKSCDANKKIILAQAEAFYLEKGHKYPQTVKELVEENYLREEPICASAPEHDNPYYFSYEAGELTVMCHLHDHSDKQ